MGWIKKTPPPQTKLKNKQANKQTIIHKTVHIKQKIELHETRVENRELISAWFIHFRKYNKHRDLMGNFLNNGPTFLKLIVRVRIYHILIYRAGIKANLCPKHRPALVSPYLPLAYLK